MIAQEWNGLIACADDLQRLEALKFAVAWLENANGEMERVTTQQAKEQIEKKLREPAP